MFTSAKRRAVEGDFNGGQVTSDGGLLLLRGTRSEARLDSLGGATVERYVAVGKGGPFYRDHAPAAGHGAVRRMAAGQYRVDMVTATVHLLEELAR